MSGRGYSQASAHSLVSSRYLTNDEGTVSSDSMPLDLPMKSGRGPILYKEVGISMPDSCHRSNSTLPFPSSMLPL